MFQARGRRKLRLIHRVLQRGWAVLKIVPSQVVQALDTLWPFAVKPTENMRIGNEQSGRISGLINLVDAIPPELIQLNGRDLPDFVLAISLLRSMVEIWTTQGNVDVPQKIHGYHPIPLLRTLLVKCPDSAPSSETIELSFVDDSELRASMRLDISEAESALRGGAWKSTTVLAGSVCEALLLWAISKIEPTKITQASEAIKSAGKVLRSSDLDKWTLHEYIHVAKELKLIAEDTATQAVLAKEFRNLIHPGRAKRLGSECNRATALSALAAVEHVVHDLAAAQDNFN
jgi:hypothetical protein